VRRERRRRVKNRQGALSGKQKIGGGGRTPINESLIKGKKASEIRRHRGMQNEGGQDYESKFPLRRPKPLSRAEEKVTGKGTGPSRRKIRFAISSS